MRALAAVALAANARDVTAAHELMREGDEALYGDSGYLGVEKREEIKNDGHFKGVEHKINRRSSSIKASPKDGRLLVAEKDEDGAKSPVRCKAERIFLIIKMDFGYAKAMHRGLAKNSERFYMLFALANILKRARAGRAGEFCMA